jgi:hypothetical protein
MTRIDTDGLETSTRELSLTLKPPYVPSPEGTLRLRCEARILDEYSKSSMLILNSKRLYDTNQPKPERGKSHSALKNKFYCALWSL